MRRLALLLVLLLVLLLAVPLAPARADVPAPPSTWFRLTGLDGVVRAWAVAPPDLVLAGLAAGGVRRSTDGGATWAPYGTLPAGARVDALLIAGATAYAGTSAGLFRSTGADWSLVLATPVRSLARAGSVVLAGTDGGGVVRSTDGTTWSSTSGLPTGESVADLDAVSATTAYAAGSTGVHVSSDAGATWARVSDGLPGSGATQVRAWPQRPGRVVAVTGDGRVHLSRDSGASWAQAGSGLDGSVRDLQALGSDEALLLYAATDTGLWAGRLRVDDTSVTWRGATGDGLGADPGLGSLTPPVLAGQGSPGLAAGATDARALFLGFSPPGSVCSPTSPTATAPCPVVTGTLAVGRTLSATHGTWAGTGRLAYAYQWERCTSTTASSCDPLVGATASQLVVPQPGRYRVVVTASGPAPTADDVRRASRISEPAVDPAASPLRRARRWSPPSHRRSATTCG